MKGMRVITTATAAALGICLISSAHAAPSLVGDSLAPPAALDGVRAGMTLDEAKPALVSFRLDGSYKDAANRQRLVRDAGGGAKYYVLVANNAVARIGIEAPERGLVDKLSKKWGSPGRTVNMASEGLTTWSDGAWRVDLACRQTLCRLAFHKTLTTDFFGAAVAPPGPLAQLKLGMSRDDMRKMSTELARGAEVPAGPEDVRLAVDYGSDDRVRSVLVAGLPPNAAEMIVKAWGAPEEVSDAPTWFNPRNGWRARYDAQLGVVQLTEYMPLMAMLGAGDTLAIPLIGLTEQQIASAFPKRQQTKAGIAIALPPTEFATALTMVGLTFDPSTGRTTAAVFALPFDTQQHKAMLVAVLEAKWGKSKEKLHRGKRVLTFPGAKQRVSVAVDQPGELLVEVR